MAGTVTALRVQRRNSKRVSVYLDDRFAFGLQATGAAGLRVGQWLEDADIEVMREADVMAAAYQQALDFLSYRPRSVQEVRRNLSDKGCSEATVDATLSRLEERGLIDDVEFALYWIEQRKLFRPRGAAMLRYELRQKGVDDDAIRAALETIDEEGLAYEAARRRAEHLSTLSRDDFKRKLGSFLARRGFPYSIVRETLDRLQDERDPDSEN